MKIHTILTMLHSNFGIKQTINYLVLDFLGFGNVGCNEKGWYPIRYRNEFSYSGFIINGTKRLNLLGVSTNDSLSHGDLLDHLWRVERERMVSRQICPITSNTSIEMFDPTGPSGRKFKYCIREDNRIQIF
jgi:hypothetical protein